MVGTVGHDHCCGEPNGVLLELQRLPAPTLVSGSSAKVSDLTCIIDTTTSFILVARPVVVAGVNGGQEPLLFGDEMAVLGQAVEVLLMRRFW
jgi:hypothetical protein